MEQVHLERTLYIEKQNKKHFRMAYKKILIIL